MTDTRREAFQRAEEFDALLNSTRTIAMTRCDECHYDPLPLIRTGAKAHTLRGSARIVGQVAQVTMGGKRIPLWLRWVARERVVWPEIATEEFAFADGFRGASPLAAMTAFFKRLKGREPREDDGFWLLHFEVFADRLEVRR